MSILQRLPDTQDTYLLLDGAQFDSVEHWLYKHLQSSSYTLIYENTELANAREVSPCLINLGDSDNKHIVDQFCSGAEQHAWGIFLTVFQGVSNDALIKHLRSILFVKTDVTDKGVFRWYDPRICRHLLEKSSTSELSELMGPIATIMLAHHSQGWLEFSNPQQMERHDNLLHLSANQIIATHEAGEEVFTDRLTAHLLEYFPDRFSNHSETEMRSQITDWMQKSDQLGFTDQLSRTLFCNIVSTLGEICIDQTHSPYKEITALLVQKSSLTPTQRIERAADLTAELAENHETSQLKPVTGTES